MISTGSPKTAKDYEKLFCEIYPSELALFPTIEKFSIKSLTI
jgi:hypothetical protein